ncbi:MAG: hypothetical protein WDZ49_13275 [Litorilinea sp.]
MSSLLSSSGYARTRRPAGQPTRGKTAPNRLRRVDTFAILYDTPLLTRQTGDFAQAFFVDLGYGETPVTTLESAARLRALNPALPVLGVEIDRARVAAAQAAAGDAILLRVGGFNLPLARWRVGPWAGRRETVRMVRAFNVLRQYAEADAAPAYALLGQYVLPGGLLLEGTSNPDGSLWVANVARRTDVDAQPWHTEALVFSHNLRHLFDPVQHQAVLPKHLIHRMATDHAIDGFMAAWKQAIAETAGYRSWGPRQWWVAAARRLAALGFAVDTRDRWLARGFLVWKNPGV